MREYLLLLVDLCRALLPPLNDLNRLADQAGTQQVTFTTVGYGLQAVKPQPVAVPERRTATVRLVNLHNALVDGYQMATTGARGTGGATCFGDSGGPFLHGDNTVVAVTSWGPSATCLGTGYAYRTDTAAAREFLRPYIAVP